MKYIIIAFALFLFFSCQNGKSHETVLDSNFYYTCSMDPQVVSNKPGKCPICKMELTKVQKQVGGLSGQLELSAQQIKLGNIQVDSIHNGSIGDEMVLTGTVNFDQINATNISARVTGRIEKLFFKNLGDQIKKGDPVFEIYSEELNNAKQEYLLIQDKQRAFAAETLIDFQQLLLAAKNKLLLWGMTEQQIQELSKIKKTSNNTVFYSPAGGYISQLNYKQGDYLMEGASLLKISDLEKVWVEAQVYTSQMANVSKNSMALARLPELLGLELKGQIEFINPEINPDSRINLIRVTIPNQNHLLKPGMAAYVVFKSAPRKSLTLPTNAVIRDASGAMVWVETAKNKFQPMMVETGLEMDDQIEIKSGLKNGMAVVVSGAYLLNSEYQFKKGASPMEQHHH
jgi:Cu(I)/Ag(I) efflux system membrane fusion protein